MCVGCVRGHLRGHIYGHMHGHAGRWGLGHAGRWGLGIAFVESECRLYGVDAYMEMDRDDREGVETGAETDAEEGTEMDAGKGCRDEGRGGIAFVKSECRSYGVDTNIPRGGDGDGERRVNQRDRRTDRYGDGGGDGCMVGCGDVHRDRSRGRIAFVKSECRSYGVDTYMLAILSRPLGGNGIDGGNTVCVTSSCAHRHVYGHRLYLGIADRMSIARVWVCRYSK